MKKKKVSKAYSKIKKVLSHIKVDKESCLLVLNLCLLVIVCCLIVNTAILESNHRYELKVLELEKETLKNELRTSESYNTEYHWTLQQWNEWYARHGETMDMLDFYKRYFLEREEANDEK